MQQGLPGCGTAGPGGTRCRSWERRRAGSPSRPRRSSLQRREHLERQRQRLGGWHRACQRGVGRGYDVAQVAVDLPRPGTERVRQGPGAGDGPVELRRRGARAAGPGPVQVTGQVAVDPAEPALRRCGREDLVEQPEQVGVDGTEPGALGVDAGEGEPSRCPATSSTSSVSLPSSTCTSPAGSRRTTPRPRRPGPRAAAARRGRDLRPEPAPAQAGAVLRPGAASAWRPWRRADRPRPAPWVVVRPRRGRRGRAPCAPRRPAGTGRRPRSRGARADGGGPASRGPAAAGPCGSTGPAPPRRPGAGPGR